MSVFDGVKLGDFTLHSGGSSPVLFDVPAMLELNRDRKYIQDILISRMPNVTFHAIVGIEFGGGLLAMLLAEWFQDKRLGFYRKDGGLTLKFPNEKIVLVDDVVTTGSSIAEARLALAAAGHEVISVISFINRKAL